MDPNTPQNNPALFVWLGRISGVLAVVTAFVYGAGFIAFISHYQVLGIHSSQTPAQQYLEFGGRFIAVVFQFFIPGSQNLIRHISAPEYNIPGMNWGQPWFSWWWTTLTCLLVWAVAYWQFFHKIRKISSQIIFKLVAVLGMIIFAGAVISLESEVLRLHSCLQSFDAQTYGKALASLPPKSGQSDYGDIQSRVQKSAGKLTSPANQENTPHFARLFALEHEHGYELPRIMTFFRLVCMAGITLVTVFCFAGLTKKFPQNSDQETPDQSNPAQNSKWLCLPKIFKIIFYILLAAQLVFLPAGYGILGREYLYPAVRIDYKYNNKVTSDFPVIMLMNDDKETIVYDRINLMQIKRIPKSAVLKIEQFFLVSPFSNCSDDIDPEKFIPCEIQAIPH